MTSVMELCSSATRGCVIAPPGKKLVIADLSNIEGRVLAWLAGEEWKLKAFRDFDKGEGHDLYKLAYAKAFGIDPADVDKDMRQIGKTMELALGYAGGVGAFITFSLAFNIDLEAMADKAIHAIPDKTLREARDFLEWQLGQGKSQFGLSDSAFLVCESFKRLWREAHPAISSWWKELENVCVAAVNSPGQTYTCRRHKIRRDGAWLRILLPSGRYLCYPSPRVEEGGGLTYMGINQYSRKWERLRTYGGKLVENCISEGTEVLTEKFGWLAIERVTPDTRVWDGIDWVSFSHCVYKGKQTTITTFGVEMTPDHLVLTEEGWLNASSCEGHNRVACRLPDSAPVPRIDGEEVDMGGRLRLREGNSHGSFRTPEAGQAGNHCVLWVHAQGDDRTPQYSARDEHAPGLCSMAGDERPLPVADASGVQKLWREGYRSLRAVAGEVRKLLGRHGAYLQSGLDYRALGQFVGVFQRELCVADSETPGKQHPTQPLVDHPARENDVRRSVGVLQGWIHDTAVPPGPRVADRTSSNTRRVFDLVDCGPRSRFVVSGPRG